MLKLQNWNTNNVISKVYICRRVSLEFLQPAGKGGCSYQYFLEQMWLLVNYIGDWRALFIIFIVFVDVRAVCTLCFLGKLQKNIFWTLPLYSGFTIAVAVLFTVKSFHLILMLYWLMAKNSFLIFLRNQHKLLRNRLIFFAFLTNKI